MLGATTVMDDAQVARATEMSMSHVKPPLHVAGYQQEQFLGRGAYGEVWKAVDSNSGRIVAIKFYNRRGGLDWSHMAREVEKLQYLFYDQHVVQLLDVGWDATPPYYVMEYMDHGSLEDRLKAGPMPIPEAVTMARNIAQGLARAHDRGILHCDLKPDNIMLDEEGNPKLADFGQSRLKREHAPALGTLFYMAPEQADLSMVPDARWDVYALGVILYRMVTGKLPYLTKDGGESVASQGAVENRLRAYSQLIHDSPAPKDHYHVRGIDSGLRRIIDRCLAANPKHRFPNVQSVLYALALRDSKRAQEPLLMLGILGPALVVLLMSVVTMFLFDRTLRSARMYLLDRTAESNQFAGKLVADQFAAQIDRRWQILESDARHGPLLQWLQTDDDQIDKSVTPADIATWLRGRYEYWNTQFSQKTTAAFWYILDRRGIVRAISPTGENLVGKYFGFREYFHGQQHQLDVNAPVPPVISAVHRSNVFHSQPTNRPAFSLSVPIRDGQQTLGVLVMESELGHFAEFQGARDQQAVLVDLRPDETGRRGLIVEHPRFEQQLKANQRLGEYYVSEGTLESFDRSRPEQGKLSRASDHAALSDVISLDSYRDPVENGDSDGLIAVAVPVLIDHNGTEVIDSNWVLLIQEKRAETMEPITRLQVMVVWGSVAVLILVVLLVAGLWWLVIHIRDAPHRLRGSQVWSGQLSSTGSITSSSVSK